MPPPGGGRNPGHERERRSKVRVQNERRGRGPRNLPGGGIGMPGGGGPPIPAADSASQGFVSARTIVRKGMGRDGLTRGSAGTAKRRRREPHWRCARRSAHPGRSTHSGGSTHAGRRSTESAAAHHSAHRSARETHCSRHKSATSGTGIWKARNTHSEELRLMGAGQTSRWTPSTWATRPVRVARSSPVHLRRSRTAA